MEKLDVGNYVLFIGEVQEAEVLSSGSALTLDDYQNSTPATATVYRTKQENFGWRCTVCGYIAEKEELPEGFQCPLCRADRSKFVKLS